MKIRIPKALQHMLLYGVSIALMKSVSLLMLPFIAHHLSTEAFGRLEVISTLAVFGSVLVGMGLDQTLFRFAGSERDPARRKRLAAEIFCLALLIGALAWIIGWQAAEIIARLIPGNPTTYELQLVLSMLALEGCIAIPLGWLRLQDRAISFFLLTTGRALTQALLVFILLNFGHGVEGVLEAALIAAVAQAILLCYLQFRDTGLRLGRNTSVQALVYSLPLVGSGLVAFTLNGLDRWILAEYASLNDVAQFSVAAKFSLAVVLLMQPFGMWWAPRRFAVLNEPGGKQKVAHFVTLGISLSIIITVLVGLISPLLIGWLMPDSFVTSIQYVAILVLVMLLREVTELVNLGCFTGNTTGIQFTINTIAAILGMMAMLWWVPIYGAWGIIFALLCAQLLRLIFFFTVSQKRLPLPYPVRSLLLLSTLSIGWLILGSQMVSSTQQLIAIVTAATSLLAIALFLRLIPVPVINMSK